VTPPCPSARRKPGAPRPQCFRMYRVLSAGWHAPCPRTPYLRQDRVAAGGARRHWVPRCRFATLCSRPWACALPRQPATLGNSAARSAMGVRSYPLAVGMLARRPGVSTYRIWCVSVRPPRYTASAYGCGALRGPAVPLLARALGGQTGGWSASTVGRAWRLPRTLAGGRRPGAPRVFHTVA